MKLGQLGVWYASDKLKPAQWSDLISTVESLGYTTQWYSESRIYESMSFGSYLLSCSKTLNIGSSIANIYARDAVSTASAMHTLNAISDGRYMMGLGVSHIPLVEGLRKHSYSKPVATMRAYLEAMALFRESIAVFEEMRHLENRGWALGPFGLLVGA